MHSNVFFSSLLNLVNLFILTSREMESEESAALERKAKYAKRKSEIISAASHSWQIGRWIGDYNIKTSLC